MKKYRSIFFEADAGAGSGGGGAGTLLTQSQGAAGGAEAGAGDGSGAGAGTQTTTSWLGPDGSFVEKWTDQLPAELGDSRNSLARFKTPAELATSYIGAQKLLGEKGNMVKVPTADSKPEEVAAFRKALGVPESPDGYQLKPESLPEGVSWDDANAKPFAAIAHKYNIPPGAMKELVAEQLRQEGMRGTVVAGMAEQTLAEGDKVLRQTFGDKYDNQMSKANQMAALVGADPRSKGFEDPNVVIALAKAASFISEDKFTQGGAPTMQTGKAAAMDIIENENNPLHKKYTEGDPTVLAQVRAQLNRS